jgi:two-component system LytT family response regulator
VRHTRMERGREFLGQGLEQMATAMYAYPPIASKCVGGIRVVLCDPDDEVRAALRAIIESDSLLVVVAESRDWATCEADVEDLVPELLIARAGLIPLPWSLRTAQDAFAPLVIKLNETYGIAAIASDTGEMSIPIDANTARKSLDRAVAEIYDRKAKQLLYLVGRYVEASNTAPVYEPIIMIEQDGQSVPVVTDAIMAVVAARKCVVLHTSSGRSMLREPIHQMAEKLDPAVFIRIHRSVIINLNHLDYGSITEKCSHIVLADGSRYPVGRNYRQNLSTFLRRAS